MADLQRLLKLTDADEKPVKYGNVWKKEATTGPERLVIGADDSHVDLLVRLMSVLPEPFGILYVLIVSHCGHEPGRYQLNQQLSRDDAELFIWDFQTYFEQDGRHHLWIASLHNHETLIYDRHNRIYAYGPLDEYLALLPAEFGEGQLAIPCPHAHHYNIQFSAHEDRIMSDYSWTWHPLQPDDED